MGADRSGERGAALVEFAILMPLLLMLLLGIVSVGVAYNHQISLTHAAREAGRSGATLPVSNFNAEPSPIQAWLDAVAAQAVADATGSLDPSTPGLMVCVAYVHPNGTLATDSTASRVDTTGTVTYPSAPCFTDGRPDSERRVQVRVERAAEFNVVAFSRTLTIQSDAVSRFEAALGA